MNAAAAATSATNQNETAHDFVDKAADKIHKLINNAGEEIEETKEALSERLKISPVASMIIALGAGMVLDRVIQRKPAPMEISRSHLPEFVTGLAAIGQTAASQILYRQLFASAAKITAFSVFGSVLAGMGAAGVFYAFYLLLLGYGVSAQLAIASVSALALGLAAIVMFAAGRAISRMHSIASWLPLVSGARGFGKKFAKSLKDIID